MKQRMPGATLRESNPVVGPIYVEGAEEGDLLAVHIQRIRLNRDFAISKQGANFGSLTGEGLGHIMLYNEPIPTIWYEWKLDLERQVGDLELPNSRLKRAEVPLSPFIGSIGVAPRFGRVETTLTPGEYGGNMDCVETARVRRSTCRSGPGAPICPLATSTPCRATGRSTARRWR